MKNLNYNHEPRVGQAYYGPGGWGMSLGEGGRGYPESTADYFQQQVLEPGYPGQPHGFAAQSDWSGREPGPGANPWGGDQLAGDRTPASPGWSANAQTAYQFVGRPGHPAPEQPDPRSGPYRGIGPRGYQRSDERIQELIHERFTDDPYLNPTDVEIQVHAGVARLTGTVTDRAQKRRAEDLAEDVTGVKDVENFLTIQKGR